MRSISVEDLNRRLQQGGCNVVDVRSPAEFASGHVPGAVNIPMEQVESRLEDMGAGPLLLICQGGQRARLVADRLQPLKPDLFVVEGGTSAWIKGSYPVVRCVRSCWSLDRQVRLGAGIIVLLGVLLMLLISPAWIGLSAFAGAGLTLAGLTDFCPMGVVLSKMPWNQPHRTAVRKITDTAESSM